MKRTWMAAGALALVLGCGSDDEPPPAQGKNNDENAKANGKQQTTAIYAAMDGNGVSAADALYSAGSSSQGTVSAQSLVLDLEPQNLHTLADPPGCTCTGKTCTFTDCERNTGGKVKINGTLSAENGTFKADLTWEVDASGLTAFGSNTKIHIKADLTVTDTSITGTYHTDGNVEVKGITINVPGAQGLGNVSWTNDATWNVTVANKQPTAGTITYSGTYVTAGRTYSANGTATYP